MYIENNWSGWMSINEFTWQPNSYQYSENLETRWPLGWITLQSNKYSTTLASRVVCFFRNYAICDNWAVYQLDSSETWFTSVWNLWLSSILNCCEFQGFIFFARTTGLSRIPVADFLSQTFGTLQTNFVTYSIKTGTNYDRITTTTSAHRIPYVDTGTPSSLSLFDRDWNDVITFNTNLSNSQYYIYSTSWTLSNWPYALNYTISAPTGISNIPMYNYYDDKLIFAIGNKVLYIQDLSSFVYLGMNLVVGQKVAGITASGWYVKVYATQDNKDTKVHFWRGWEVTEEWFPAKPEQTVPLDWYVVRNIASEWSMDYLMAWEPDYGGNPDQGTSHFFIGQGSTFYKIKSGRFLRRWPTQDYHFSYRQILSNLAVKNWIVYIPCGDWLYSYGTLHKDIPASLQKDFELRSWVTKILPFAIHQYNGTIFMSYELSGTYYLMKYAQDYEYASYEESGYIIGRVYTGWKVSAIKRVNKILMWFEFETTPDWTSKSWDGWTINLYLRNNRNSTFELIKTVTDTSYKWEQTMRCVVSPVELKTMQSYHMLEYKIELVRWASAKTPHVYEYILDDTVINE